MSEVAKHNDLKIVVIGGGTGSFMLLNELKNYTNSISALVNMADDGGSTGVLRDELGTLPPGDVRQCLVALSDSPKMRNMFNYRFEEGTFEGHAFGNLLLSALEKMTGSFSEAVETASEILRINGKVIPITLDDVRLKMEWSDRSVTLHGESVIDADSFAHDPRKATLSLIPSARANPDALQAIKEADLIVIAPGDLYTSLGPLLIIDGVGDTLRSAAAPILYVSNLVTKQGQTDGFSVCDHADEIERFAGGPMLDYVIYNNQQPDEELAERYKQEGAYLVGMNHDELSAKHYQGVACELLGPMALRENFTEASKVTRSLIRHDSAAVSRVIMDIYSKDRNVT
jgi:uncharacterized cofD-like protein